MKVELITITQGVGKYAGLSNEEVIAAIARHGTIKQDNGKLVKYLMDKNHWSPLEMIDFGFEIYTSRAIGRHILRHDMQFQEKSLRYDNAVDFEPIEIRKEHPTNRQSSSEIFNPILRNNETAQTNIDEVLGHVQYVYKMLLESGVAKEVARMILPECTTTILTAKTNLRNWLTFLNVRTDQHAQKEIRSVAQLIGESLEKELPNIFSTIQWRNGLFM